MEMPATGPEADRLRAVAQKIFNSSTNDKRMAFNVKRSKSTKRFKRKN
jgi:hypothetical protein